MPFVKGPAQYKPCIVCGQTMRIRPCEQKIGKKMCSSKCYAVYKKGAGNPNWRGGRITDSSGRVMVYAPGHPDARLFGGTHIYEYRLVAAGKIGRPLTADEIVHHVNGDPSDNRPENLEVMTQAQHILAHHLPTISGAARRARRQANGSV
jgi:hypothetical protein